jgi:Na+/H+ antiporter NhaD/arsenite permease-like protein
MPAIRLLLSAVLVIVVIDSAHAAALDGHAMSWRWALPFAGLLLTIATGPLLFPKIWHAHYGKIAAGWALLALVPLAVGFGASAAFEAFVHAILAEYLSFIVLLFALYTVAGGILVTGKIRCTTLNTTTMLALGASIASIVGTTGAAMIMIRPVMRAIEDRKHRAHVIVFFIILVANVGGALTPLGDPPLFVGFLRGVDFFWTAEYLWAPTLMLGVIILAMFFAVDTLMMRKESRVLRAQREEPIEFRIRGVVNFLLVGAIISGILMSAVWKPGISFNVFGTDVQLQNIARDLELIAIALLSLWLTPREHRASNGFSWEPIREVAKLFAAIFVAIIPVLAMLQAGLDGPFGGLLSAMSGGDGAPNRVAYFWVTGILSAFLDNAPTYLVFYELAGGDPVRLMGPLSGTLTAISMGAVYMGALTYIGNAPNFMIYAIAQERGIVMPSFFAYFAWACLIMAPGLILISLLFL